MEQKETFWDKLDPKHKKIVMVIGLTTVFIAFAIAVMPSDKPLKRNNEVQHVLTDVRGKDMGIESLLAQLKISNDNIKSLERQLASVTQELDMTRSETTANKNALSRVSQLERDFREKSKKQDEINSVLSTKLTQAKEENAKLKRALETGKYATDGKGKKSKNYKGSKTDNTYNGYNYGDYENGSNASLQNTSKDDVDIAMPEFKDSGSFSDPSTDPLAEEKLQGFYVDTAKNNADNVQVVTPVFKDTENFINPSTDPLAEEKLQGFYVDAVQKHAKENAKPTFAEKMAQEEEEEKPLIDRNVDLNDVEGLYAQAPMPGESTDEGYVIPQDLQIHFISESEESIAQREPQPPKEEEDSIFIPSGSLIKGVLLAGLDAPTGTNARQDPFPVPVRIQHEAILPNGYKADLKECFLLMSGYGDLSSERALLRGETLSCIRDDGAIMQTKLPSYVTGEDGKAGIRGRLVSKTGTILAKTLLAGFASGVAQAFDVNMTPTINTSSDGTVSYEKVYSTDALQGAAVSGISSALDKLADYYMTMAEEMFPIIEIDAAREVSVFVTNGTSLSVVKGPKGSAPVTPKVITDDGTELQ